MKKASEKETEAMKVGLARQIFYLGPHEEAVNKRARMLSEEHFVERLWQKDGSLWKEDAAIIDQIKGSLGWLDSPGKMASMINDIYEFTAEAFAKGVKGAVLMGMGGSSLAPLLFEKTFDRGPGGIPVKVLDTTDPATILAIERSVSLRETLFIVASKSGSTAEPNAFDHYFYSKMEEIEGLSAGGNFAAITDPGSPLEAEARKRCFGGIIHNFKDIGGRYSALSFFGLLPAALMGLDVEKLLLRALRMAKACTHALPVVENPGVMLGAAMGELALKGIDKLTFLIAEPLSALGLWLEQLVAESLGKEGLGILPVVGEPPGVPSDYGDDRLFIAISAATHKDLSFEKSVDALKRAGKPVIVIRLNDLHDVTQEFFRFEIATATAGRIIGVNPFDQPNVQESKDVTKHLLHEIEVAGHLTEPEPIAREGELSFFGDGKAEAATPFSELFFPPFAPPITWPSRPISPNRTPLLRSFRGYGRP